MHARQKQTRRVKKERAREEKKSEGDVDNRYVAIHTDTSDCTDTNASNQ